LTIASPVIPSMPRPRLQATIAHAVTTSLWLWRGGPLPAALAIIAAALALLAWLSPRAYAPFARAFEKLGHGFLAVFTWFALGLIYFGVFTPLRLLRSLRRHDPLQRRFDPTAKTYLRPLPQTPPNFDRQF
jgi:hypothetical protein